MAQVSGFTAQFSLATFVIILMHQAFSGLLTDPNSFSGLLILSLISGFVILATQQIKWTLPFFGHMIIKAKTCRQMQKPQLGELR